MISGLGATENQENEIADLKLRKTRMSLPGGGILGNDDSEVCIGMILVIGTDVVTDGEFAQGD